MWAQEMNASWKAWQSENSDVIITKNYNGLCKEPSLNKGY